MDFYLEKVELYEAKCILDVKYESVIPDGLVAVCDYINTKERQELLILLGKF